MNESGSLAATEVPHAHLWPGPSFFEEYFGKSSGQKLGDGLCKFAPSFGIEVLFPFISRSILPREGHSRVFANHPMTCIEDRGPTEATMSEQQLAHALFLHFAIH